MLTQRMQRRQQAVDHFGSSLRYNDQQAKERKGERKEIYNSRPAKAPTGFTRKFSLVFDDIKNGTNKVTGEQITEHEKENE